MTTTEDNEDQEALGVVRAALTDPSDDANDAYRKDLQAERILSALSEAGYTVVKTEDARRWLLDYAYSPDDVVFGERGLTDDQLPALHELLDIVLPDWRLSWEPVPEGGEQ